MDQDSGVRRGDDEAAALRGSDAPFARWAAGRGVIRHTDETQLRVHALVGWLEETGVRSRAASLGLLEAADRVTSAGMWLVVHLTYARRVRLDGQPLAAADFKSRPEGHTGGALNMVPAYTGYLLADALTGHTRAWLMGQGHCVAAIDSVNVLVGNLHPAHAERYDVTDEGLTAMVNDFYAYRVRPDGLPESPLGSHVNAHTAGGIQEGGYLGFAELQYVHMPEPGERLVAFLSDGAFEEQRGSDWAPRWWRSEDSGLATPVMIANGRRIDQRTTLSQGGGVEWLRAHLRLWGFDPVDVDGRDPAAIAWSIIDAERRFDAFGDARRRGEAAYPIPYPYVVAETVKGYGFPGAGTNRAHNLPLRGDPATDAAARAEFHAGAAGLHVPAEELTAALEAFQVHEAQGRPRERDHALARYRVEPPEQPEIPWRTTLAGSASPMAGIDATFSAIVAANPRLRPRVGNPDEMRSNRLSMTLEQLQHRVTQPEEGVPESITGAVITALNEEAVVCAALANKRGINLVASYEAFAVKMLGALRQELIFARHQREAGREPGWLGVPVIATSHSWENGKNEQSHQDPTLCEAMLGEMSDVSRVVFPADWNTACATIAGVYRTHGTVHTLVVPKNAVADRFTPEAAVRLLEQGAAVVEGDDAAEVQFIAIGAYQLEEAVRAAARCRAHGVPCSVVYVLEPGRFRVPRDRREAEHVADLRRREQVIPHAPARVFLSHTRPEVVAGVMRPLADGPEHCRFLGYRNRGGTLDVFGMLFANGCTWAHAVAAAAELTGRAHDMLLTPTEMAAAVGGTADPDVLRAS